MAKGRDVRFSIKIGSWGNGGHSVKKGGCNFFFFFTVWNIPVIMFKIGGEIAILDLAKAPKSNTF